MRKPLLYLLAFLILPSAISLPAQVIDVPYRGLDYLMLSKNGITVMIAPLDLNILHYSAAHVWITNGSTDRIEVEPEQFVARARTLRSPQPAAYRAVHDGNVVSAVLRGANFGDIMALVRAYERNLFGFRNNDAISFYQNRKQVALAEGGSRRMRAAATVSALVLHKTEVPPGEFREGTVFFDTTGRSEFLEFSVRLAIHKANGEPDPERPVVPEPLDFQIQVPSPARPQAPPARPN